MYHVWFANQFILHIYCLGMNPNGSGSRKVNYTRTPPLSKSIKQFVQPLGTSHYKGSGWSSTFTLGQNAIQPRRRDNKDELQIRQGEKRSTIMANKPGIQINPKTLVSKYHEIPGSSSPTK